MDDVHRSIAPFCVRQDKVFREGELYLLCCCPYFQAAKICETAT